MNVKNSSKVDPLEALKRDEAGKPLDPLDVPPPAPPSAPPPVVAAKPKPPPAAKVAPAKKMEFTVKSDAKYMAGGHYVKLKAGTVIDAAGFGGMPGIAKLKAMGIDLEEVRPPEK